MALLMTVATASHAKQVLEPHVYMFGFSGSFTDSLIYMTDIQDVQQIKLFDLKGRLVKNTRSITTYTDGLQNGTYVLCRIYADGTESVQKITVKK
jgi:hypothetical protein